MDELHKVAKALKAYGQPHTASEVAKLSLDIKASIRRADDGVGRIILDQMGGAGRIRAMLGATMVLIPHGVMIKWPSREPSRGNLVEITLDPSDTYNLTFFNATRGTKKVVKKYDDIYFDQLVELFERQTGLYLRLS